MNRKNVLISFVLLCCGYITYTQNTTSDIQLQNSLSTEQESSLQGLEKKIAEAKSKYNKAQKAYLQTVEGRKFLQARRDLRWCHEGIGQTVVDCSFFKQQYESAKFEIEQTSTFREFDKAKREYSALFNEKLDTQHHC